MAGAWRPAGTPSGRRDKRVFSFIIVVVSGERSWLNASDGNRLSSSARNGNSEICIMARDNSVGAAVRGRQAWLNATFSNEDMSRFPQVLGNLQLLDSVSGSRHRLQALDF